MFRIAAILRPMLVGRRLVWAEVRLGDFGVYGRLRGEVARVPALAGRAVVAVASVGKHLVFDLGEARLRVHLGMAGAVHRYAPGEPWRRQDAGVVLETAEDVVVVFRPSSVSMGAGVGRELANLGPDLLGPDLDLDAVVARALGEPDRSVARVLLDQRVACGVGNVFKSEALFLERVHPERAVGDVDLRALYARARALLRRNTGGGPRTTRDGPGSRLWVYGRAGRPCLACGERVAASRHGGRGTWWCPGCQPA